MVTSLKHAAYDSKCHTLLYSTTVEKKVNCGCFPSKLCMHTVSLRPEVKQMVCEVCFLHGHRQTDKVCEACFLHGHRQTNNTNCQYSTRAWTGKPHGLCQCFTRWIWRNHANSASILHWHRQANTMNCRYSTWAWTGRQYGLCHYPKWEQAGKPFQLCQYSTWANTVKQYRLYQCPAWAWTWLNHAKSACQYPTGAEMGKAYKLPVYYMGKDEETIKTASILHGHSGKPNRLWQYTT